MAVVEDLGVAAVEGAPSESQSEKKAEKKGVSGGTIWLSTRQWLLMTVTPAYAPLYARLHERCNEHFRPGMHIEPGMTEASFWEPLLASQQQANHDGTGLFLAGFHKAAEKPEIGCVISFVPEGQRLLTGVDGGAHVFAHPSFTH